MLKCQRKFRRQKVIYCLHGAQTFWRNKEILSWPRNTPYSMQPEGLLPHSQVPANCPYPETATSSPNPTSHVLNIHLNIFLPSLPGSPKWSPSSRFSHKYPVYAPLSPLRATCHAYLIFPECYRSNNSRVISNQKVPLLLHTARIFAVTVASTLHICTVN